MDNLEAQLVVAFRTVFPDLTPEKARVASQQSVPSWDSVAAITLMNVIEEECGIQLDFDMAADLTSFDLILEYLRGVHAKTAS